MEEQKRVFTSSDDLPIVLNIVAASKLAVRRSACHADNTGTQTLVDEALASMRSEVITIVSDSNPDKHINNASATAVVNNNQDDALTRMKTMTLLYRQADRQRSGALTTHP